MASSSVPSAVGIRNSSGGEISKRARSGHFAAPEIAQDDAVGGPAQGHRRRAVEVVGHRHVVGDALPLGKVGLVGARRFAQARDSGPVEGDPQDVRAERSPVGARGVGGARSLVHRVQPPHFVSPLGEGADEGPVRGVAVEVLEPGALAEPEETAAGQEVRRAVAVDPRPGVLTQDTAGFPGAGIGPVQVQEGLGPVLDLVPDVSRGREPHVHDEGLLVSVAARVDPDDVAAGGGNDAEAHLRVRVAGLGIGIDLQVEVVRDVVHDGEPRDVALVALEERDAAAVGTPPVRVEVAAPVDLLLIDPVELPVQEIRPAPGGEPQLGALEVGDVQVVVPDEGDPPSVRRETRQLLRLRPPGQPAKFVLPRLPREEVGCEIQEEPLASR